MNTVLPLNDATGGPGARLFYVLDDEPRVGAVIERLLTQTGNSARAFTRVTDLELALTLAAPDAIILDLSLEECDAVEVIRRLASAWFSGAILLISGRHDAKTIDEVRNIGKQHGIRMLPFLQKPFRMDELKSSLEGFSCAAQARGSATEFETALQNNWLELWYQPKIHLKSQLICGAEALIRMRHPERGLLAPSAFLPPPADPLHKLLAHFVMRRALADWSILAANGAATRLAINMPISVFETNEFVSNLRRYLPKHEGFPGLVIELTEDEVIRDLSLAREVAVQLKLYNIDIAIDDFGCGYSTLERLQALPFSELKIDRKYVDGCSNDQQKYLQCQKIVALAHRLNVTVVAEGVEVVGDVHSLLAMDCDSAQGFFFAKPMEREKFVTTFLLHGTGVGTKVQKIDDLTAY